MLDLKKELEFKSKIILLSDIDKISLINLLESKITIEEKYGLDFIS
jgi:hypothetical protein